MFVYEHHRCSLISVITSGSAIWDNNWEKQQQHDLPGPANRDNDLPVNHVTAVQHSACGAVALGRTLKGEGVFVWL